MECITSRLHWSVFELALTPPPPPHTHCGVHYLWFALVCFLVRSPATHRDTLWSALPLVCIGLFFNFAPPHTHCGVHYLRFALVCFFIAPPAHTVECITPGLHWSVFKLGLTPPYTVECITPGLHWSVFSLPPPPHCGVHYTWFALVCFFIATHPPTLWSALPLVCIGMFFHGVPPPHCGLVCFLIRSPATHRHTVQCITSGLHWSVFQLGPPPHTLWSALPLVCIGLFFHWVRPPHTVKCIISGLHWSVF